MTVPGYTDISHFRAPYKNSYVYTGVNGFGQEPNGQPASPVVNLTGAVEADDQGRNHWTDDATKTIKGILTKYRAVFLSDRAVKVVPFTLQELEMAKADPAAGAMLKATSAATWTEQKLKEDYVVFATMGILDPSKGEAQLAAVPASEKETVDITSRVAPILAEPKGFLASLVSNPVGLAVGVVVVGGIIMALRKKR